MSYANNLTAAGSLKGRHIVVAAENWLPYFYFHENDDCNVNIVEDQQCYEGIMYDLLLHMSLALNFTYDLVRPPDGKWGVGNADNEWNGMLGMIKRKEVDFALGPFGVIYERTKACDFTQPVLIDYWATLVPLKLEVDPWSLLRAFSPGVWLGFCLSVVSVLTTFIIMNRIFSGNNKIWTSYFGYVARTVFNEPPGWTPNAYAFEKVLTGVWAAFALIMAVAYSSNLISILTVPSVPPHVDSAEDLVGQKDMGWAITSGSILDQIGSTATFDTIFGRLYAGARFGGECIDNLQDIKEGVVGQVCERMSILKILSDDFTQTAKCNFYEGRENFLSTSFSMAFRKNSPYLSEVNDWLYETLEMGFLTPWINHQMPNATACRRGLAETVASHSGTDEADKKLTYEQTAPLFTWGLISLGVAGISFIVEIVIWRLGILENSSLDVRN